ncbi:MAG TPA: glycosyl hydrolase family 39, partial [Acidobacteriota bacterium]
TRRPDGSLAIAAWNYVPQDEVGQPKSFSLVLKGLSGPRRVRIGLLDATHGSALAAWEAMGKPSFPTREQQRRLQAEGQLPAPEIKRLPPGSSAVTSLVLPPHSLALIEVVK